MPATSSVHAQSLNLSSGDNVTVSSTGTFGVMGGKPFSNTTSSYGVSGGNNVQTSGTAAFNLTGGSLFAAISNVTDIEADGSGPVTISGGTVGVSHGGTGVDANGTGLVSISGGTFSSDVLSSPLSISRGAAVQITGGAFSDSGLTPNSGVLSIASGGSLYLFSQNDTPFTITGIPGISTFNGVSYNNTSLSLASLSSNPGMTYGINGTLADGESFNTKLDGLGTINFNLPVPAAVPEASTTVSFGLLLTLGLGGVVIAARKKKAAASA